MAEISERVERLLALLVVKAYEPGTLADKAAALSFAGLSHQEISELVGTTPQAVRQSLYAARQAATRRRQRGKK